MPRVRGTDKVVEESLETAKHFQDRVRYVRLVPDDSKIKKNVLTQIYERMWGTASDGYYYVVTQPFNRTDLHLSEDLIEEYIRIVGFERLGRAMIKKASTVSVAVNKSLWYALAFAKEVKEIGFHETVTHTLGEKGVVATVKPLASNKAWVRDTLTEGLRVALEKNLENAEVFGDDAMRLFEIGSVFSGEGERRMLGVAVGYHKTHTGNKKDFERFLDIVERVFHTRPKGDLKNGVWETDFNALLAEAPDISDGTPYPALEKPAVPYKRVSPYPSITRDIAVFVPAGISSGAVSRFIDKHTDDTLVSYRLFDTFEKNGRVSYAFRLVFQSAERTLSNEEVNNTMDGIAGYLNKNNRWEVR